MTDKTKTKKKLDLTPFKIEKPKKDHTLFCPPHLDPKIEIQEGKPVEVPSCFKGTLKTEGVI